jgi:hypothetical protein
MPTNPNPLIYTDDGFDRNDSPQRPGHRFDGTFRVELESGESIYVSLAPEAPTSPSEPAVYRDTEGQLYVPLPSGKVELLDTGDAG